MQDLLLEHMGEIFEKALAIIEQSFTWAKRWGCIVMLSQADVILQGEMDYGHDNIFRDNSQSMSTPYFQP